MANLSDNATIRSRAWELTRSNIGRLFLMYLVAGAIPSVTAVILMSIASAAMYASTALGVILMIVAFVTIILCAVALSLGLQSGYLKLIRGGSASVGDVFSRIDCSFKGLLLTLFIGLRIWLWMLPGLVVTTIGASIGNGFGVFLMIVGLILSYALMIPAAFRYCMATTALADHPEMGVMDAFHKSIEIMDGRRMTYFKLIIVLTLILMGFSLAASLLMSLLSRVAILVFLMYLVNMAISLVGSLVIQITSLMFYAECTDGGPDAAPKLSSAP